MNSCALDYFETLFDIQILIDFDSSYNVLFSHKNSIEKKLKKCFELAETFTFVSKNKTYLSLLTKFDASEQTTLSLGALTVREKKHNFELDKSSAIPEHLTEEIVEKVKSFENALMKEQVNLVGILESHDKLAKKSRILHIFITDLLSGIKLFQLRIMSSVKNENKSLSSGHKSMKIIQSKIDNIKKLQKKVFDRLVAIREKVDPSKYFEVTLVLFQIVNSLLDNISQVTESPKFQIFSRINMNLISTLNKFQIKSVLVKTKTTLNLLKEDLFSKESKIWVVIGGIWVCVWLGTRAILRFIQKVKHL